MNVARSRGWLVAALVLAVTLLVASIAMAVAAAGHRGPADFGPRWGSTQTSRDLRGGPGMMDDDDWSEGRSGLPGDCLDMMRGREGR